MTMKKHSLQSAILAVALMFGTSTVMTVGHALAAPTAAQAGVLGKIKGAAKTVGKGAATVGKGAVRAGKGVGSGVKDAAVVAGKALKPAVGKSLARASSAVRRAAGKI